MILLEILNLLVKKHEIDQNVVIGEPLVDVGLVLSHVFGVPLKNSIDVENLQVCLKVLDQSLRGRLLISVFVLRFGHAAPLFVVGHLPLDDDRFALAVFIAALFRLDRQDPRRFLRTSRSGRSLLRAKALPTFDSLRTVATSGSYFVDFTSLDVVPLDVELVRPHTEDHLFEVPKDDTLLDEFDFLRVEEAAPLLVSVVCQLLVLQLLLLFQELGLLRNHQSRSLVVLPFSSAANILFFLDRGPLVILSQLRLESFFCRLLDHLFVKLLFPEVFGRQISDKGLVFVEEVAVS